MKVIVITGYANTGKTTICRLLKKRLTERSHKIHYCVKTDNTSNDDFFAIIESGNKVFAISSASDTPEEIDKLELLLKYANEKGLDIDYLFLTSRTKNTRLGDIRTRIWNIANYYDLDFYEFYINKIQKNTTNNKIIVNQKNLFLDYILNVVNIFIK